MNNLVSNVDFDKVNELNSVLENLCINDSIDNINTNNNLDNEVNSIVLQLDSLNIKHNFTSKNKENKKNKENNSNVIDCDENNENNNIIAQSNLKEDDLINQNILKYYNFCDIPNQEFNKHNLIYDNNDNKYQLICLSNEEDFNIIKNLKQIISYLKNNNFVIDSIYLKNNVFYISAVKLDNIKYELTIDLNKLQFIRDKRIKYFLKNNNFIKYSGIVKVNKKTISKSRNIPKRSCKYYFKKRNNMDCSNNSNFMPYIS